MPNGTRVWPDLTWTDSGGTATANSDYGTYVRRTTSMTGTERRYEAWFDCACCEQRVVVARNSSSYGAYRACVEHHHMVCERAAGLVDSEEE